MEVCAVIHRLIFISAFLLVGCNLLSGGIGESNFINDGTVTPAIQSTHGGWTKILAYGPKAPVVQATDLSSAPASVTLTWSNAAAASGTIASYSLYRASSAGGAAMVVASGITTAARTYTDSTVSASQTYYYKAVPVLLSGEVTEVTGADAEIKIMVPPANMVLLHRWAANQDICGEMGKAVDRTQNYRCVVAGGVNAPPGTGGSGYMDFGSSIFVDRFEQGCNYTFDPLNNKCGSANGCIGTFSNPHTNVAGNPGDVYYSRRTGGCFINVGVGFNGNWLSLMGTTAANRKAMTSAAPGLPPAVGITAEIARDACSGQTVSGVSGTKRLLRRKEMVAVAAWDPTLDDVAINTIENGEDLDATGHCNSNFGSPQWTSGVAIGGSMAYSNAAVPTALDTLPACLNDVCSGLSGSQFRSVRTGSLATKNCVSKYGAQDLVGNVWEMHSDQALCAGGTCTGVTATANSVDNTNDDFAGVTFNGTQAPTATNVFSTWGRIQFPLGLPIANAGFTGDGWVTRTVAQLHNDHYRINTGAATRAVRSGSSWWDGSNAGRFSLNLNYDVSTSGENDIGFRCAITAD